MMPQKLMLALIVLLINTANGAAGNCSKSPHMSTLKKCCKIPEPDWSSFEKKCTFSIIPNSKIPSPCFLNCVFNESRALNGENLNRNNMRIMLMTLFKGNKDLVNAFILSLETCQPMIKRRISNFRSKMKGPNPKGTYCDLLGTFYTVCARKLTFISCPKSIWTHSTECESAKEYVLTCRPKIAGFDGRRDKFGKKT